MSEPAQAPITQEDILINELIVAEHGTGSDYERLVAKILLHVLQKLSVQGEK